MGSHSKPKGRSDYRHSKALTKAGIEQPWTRRYPAITLAALAGTVVGGPGGVAAAMAFDAAPAATTGTTKVVIAATVSEIRARIARHR